MGASALLRCRRAALLILLVPLFLLSLAWFVAGPGGLQRAALPAGLLGLVSPVIAYRYFRWRRDVAVARGASAEEYVRTTLTALAISAAAALLGIVVYWSSREVVALAGVAAHALNAGAIWPNQTRMALFVGRDPS